jgi:hypothetical protein
VAQGCTQTQGIDYDQTFSPVVKYESIRSVLALAAQSRMHIIQFDIQITFLHGLIDTVMYMVQLPGFEIAGEGGDTNPPVCLILKSLYGFKQLGRIWNKFFDEFLIKFDLEPTEADPYVYISKTEPWLITTLFIDDGLACCTSPGKLEALIQYMEKHFAITRSSADLYVGLHIQRDEQLGRIFIHQAIYLRRILAHFGFEGCTPLTTPADPNIKLDTSVESLDPPFSYPVAMGCLLFAQMLNRPDISYAICTVAQFSSNLQRQHYKAIKRIFRYLAGTLDLVLCFGVHERPLLLEGYSDADYVGDITDRKSHTSSLLLLNQAPVVWCSRKQSCIAMSTTESEYIAASYTTKDIIWMRRLLQNLTYPQAQPTRLF